MRSLCWQCKRRKNVLTKEIWGYCGLFAVSFFSIQYGLSILPRKIYWNCVFFTPLCSLSFASCILVFVCVFFHLFDVTTNILRMFICSLWFSLTILTYINVLSCFSKLLVVNIAYSVHIKFTAMENCSTLPEMPTTIWLGCHFVG